MSKTTVLFHCFAGTVLYLAGQVPTINQWQATGALTTGRYDGCAVALGEGRVLVAGGRADAGVLDSSEIYTAAGIYTGAAAMDRPRAGHSCVRLNDGRVLAIGGDVDGLRTASVYDPEQDRWTPLGEYGAANKGQSATLLADGRVVLAGGRTETGTAGAIEILEPLSGTLTPASGALLVARWGHTATRLYDDRILIAGGQTESGPTATVEIYDPIGDLMGVPLQLTTARNQHSATLLADGRVLIAGGSNGEIDLDTAELFLPGEHEIKAVEDTLRTARRDHLGMLIQGNGDVLLAGGSRGAGMLASTEIFQVETGQFVETGALTAARTGIVGVMLPEGRVLAIGGRGETGASAACGLRLANALNFTKSIYLNGEIAVAKGNFLTLPNRTVNFRLQRVTGTSTTTESGRLLTASVTSNSSGEYGPLNIMSAGIADNPGTWLLTATIPNTVSVIDSFEVRVQSRISATTPKPATIQGQPVVMKYSLGSDDSSLSMGGTVTGQIDSLTASTAPAIGGSGGLSICCLSNVGTYNASASYSGTSRYAPSSLRVSSHAVVSNIPQMTTAGQGAGLRLLATSKVESVLRPVSGALGPTPAGAVTVTKAGARVANVAVAPSATGEGKAVYDYTPTFDDRRARTACFSVAYTGDAAYQAVTNGNDCLPVGPGPTSLSIQSASPTYRFGEATPVTIQMFFNPNLGMVSRAVNVQFTSTAGSLPALLAAPTLTPGLGNASATATIRLPFDAKPGQVSANYAESGDLGASSATLAISMSPIPTQLRISAPVINTVTNPFSIGVQMCTNSLLPVPRGTAGGTIQILDGSLVLGTLPVPVGTDVAMCSGSSTSAVDGSSNTIIVGEVSNIVTLGNVSRPIGTRSITAIYSGNTTLLPSTAPAKSISVQ